MGCLRYCMNVEGGMDAFYTIQERTPLALQVSVTDRGMYLELLYKKDAFAVAEALLQEALPLEKR